MGPVMANVPSIGFWFPRAASDHDSLQRLMLTGRSILSGCVRRAMESDPFRALANDAIDRHWPTEAEVPDVLAPVARIFADTAAAAVVGESLWNELREPCLDLLRAIHDGIDVTRATLASTPLHRLMPEFRATREIEGPLRAAIDRHRTSPEAVGLHHLLHDPELSVHPDDQAWMLLFLLWNATIYPGSYGAWTFADVVTHVPWAEQVLAEPASRREQRWAHAFLETTRLWPVGSLVRSLSEPVTLNSGGCEYALKAGQVVGVFPWERNRQSTRWSEADRWLPDRWQESPPREGLFGLGEFRCVAEAFNERLFGCVLDAIFDRFIFLPQAPLPERHCRVHLTYPDRPWPALVRVNTRGASD
jgi:cytochrome P450